MPFGFSPRLLAFRDMLDLINKSKPMQTFENSEHENSSSFQQWISGQDGCKHFLRSWIAQSERAVLVYLHGIEGHSLWIGETAAFLQQQGISVHAMDRRGSGMSKESRGDLTDYKLLMDDCETVLQSLHAKSRKAPLFLMANCWGAKVAALLCSRNHKISSMLSGLILSSPAITVKVDLPLSKKVLIALRFFTRNLTPIEIPLNPEDFTDNPHYLDFIRRDELRLMEATSRFFVNSQILTFLSSRSASQIDIPTLIVQAGTDSIVEHEGVKKWFNRLSSADKELRIFEGIYHSLDFHDAPTEYRNVLLNWLNRQISNDANGSPRPLSGGQGQP